MKNREIKFRAFYDNEMWIVSKMQFDNGEKPYEATGFYVDTIMVYPLLMVHLNKYKKGNKYPVEQDVIYRQKNGEYSNDIIIMEFTNVKSENNKEIYEGDIVTRYINDIFEVFYKNGMPMYKCLKAESGYNKKGEIFLLDQDSCIEKVIGNIYESNINKLLK